MTIIIVLNRISTKVENEIVRKTLYYCNCLLKVLKNMSLSANKMFLEVLSVTKN